MKIDNSTIKVGDTVCIKAVTSSWVNKPTISRYTAKVVKVTSSRIYVEYVSNIRGENVSRKVSFEYRKTKRLSSQDSIGMTVYYLYKNEQELNGIENSLQKRADAKRELESVLKNKLNSMTTEQLKEAIDYFNKIN